MEENKENQEVQNQKSFWELMKELSEVQKNLALAKGKQAQAQAKETVENIKNGVDKYVEAASNGYKGRKDQVEHVKAEYQELSEMFAEQYKEDMDMYNAQRQEVDSEVFDARANLAIQKEKKKELEQNPTFVSYQKVIEGYKREIASASKNGDFEKVEAKMNELKYYQADFAKSKIGKQYQENQKYIEELKNKIVKGKEAVKAIKEAEAETNKTYRDDKKLIAGQRSTDLAKIEKQGKLKSLIGKIAAKFSGEKGFNKRVLEPIKAKVKDINAKMPEIAEAMKTRIEGTFKTVAGLTHKGFDSVSKEITSLKDKVKGGIRSFTGKVAAKKEAIVQNARAAIESKIEKTNEKLQQYDAKKVETSSENR